MTYEQEKSGLEVLSETKQRVNKYPPNTGICIITDRWLFRFYLYHSSDQLFPALQVSPFQSWKVIFIFVHCVTIIGCKGLKSRDFN